MDIEDLIDGVTDDPRQITVVAAEDVRRFIAEQGGDLYLWVSHHGGCGRCRISLLEASTQRPPDERLGFERQAAQWFDLQLEEGRRLWPRTLVLEFGRRRDKVYAYWNGQGWVG
jgi:hypothetical protein